MNTDLGNNLREVAPIISFERYGRLSKLVSVVSEIIKFLHRKKVIKDSHMLLWWGATYFNQGAKINRIKIMQRESFPTVIEFLLKPNREIPSLVKNANMFLDEYAIVRSNGRIGRIGYIDYEVINPIILPKDHISTYH